MLHAHLDTVRTASRVAGVRLVASPARPPARQQGLFDTGLRDPASFWENLARVAAIVGDERVGTPVPGDTHRPDAFSMERPAEAVPMFQRSIAYYERKFGVHHQNIPHNLFQIAEAYKQMGRGCDERPQGADVRLARRRRAARGRQVVRDDAVVGSAVPRRRLAGEGAQRRRRRA